jgi:GT2 family glycosyltransferase
LPRCSVIVATYNRSRLLPRLLDSLSKQDLPADDFEVIVVDDGSVDDTQAVLAAAQVPFRMIALKQENQGPGGARNRALEAASGSVIISVDDDVMPAPDLLRRHVEAHERNPHLAATGVMVLPPGKRLEPWLEWEAVSLQKQYDAMVAGEWRPTPRQFYTANASFRREDAIAAGLFDASFKRAEDVEFAFRLRDIGVASGFIPEAIVYHEPNRTYEQWLRVPYLYGHYDFIMWTQKNRRHIGGVLRHEFFQRQRLLQRAARVLVGRERLLNAFVALSAFAAERAHSLRLRKVSLSLYSAIFNLRYWQGMCEAMGSRQRFWQQIDHPGPAPIATPPAGNEPVETGLAH